MAKAVMGVRLLLGLIFTVFGLNGFLNFIQPPPMPDEAMGFIMALVNSGYLMTTVKIVEIICGILLLSGCYVPLACVVLAPIVVNIFLFHLFLAFSADGMVGLLSPFMLAFVAWGYRRHFQGLFVKKAQVEVG